MASSIFPYESAAALCRVMAENVNVVYVEFENNGGAPVSPPVPTRQEGISYYYGLQSHPTRDYLRVAVAARSTSISDANLYRLPNKLTIVAPAVGSQGVHGKTFGPSVSSRIYGGALVVAVEPSNPAEDILLVRFYYTTDEQSVVSSSQHTIQIVHNVVFG